MDKDNLFLGKFSVFLLLIFSYIFVYGSGSGDIRALKLPDKNFNISAFKLCPSYFIPNQSFNKNKTKIIPDNPETIAFIQTMKGRVQFTSRGVFIGMIVNENKGEIPETESKVKKKRVSLFEQDRLNSENKKMVVMGLGFGNKYDKKAVKKITPILEEPTEAKVNFFKGKKENWQVNVPTYKKLVYPEVWDGIDVEYIGYMDKLEYRVIVKPYSNPADIVMETGAEKVKLNEDGSLTMVLEGGKVRIGRPYAYQEINGKKVEVPIKFKLLGNGRYSFEIGNYDDSKTLIIDPTLEWSTFLGGDEGGDDIGTDIAIDSANNVYITGKTNSHLFPTTSGAYRTFNIGCHDVFVVKLNISDSSLVYSTYVGGWNEDAGTAIKVDSSGNAYVTGYTYSPQFPDTSGAFDTSFNGYRDAFVFKLNSTGTSLVFSTFLGGSDYDRANDITINSNGNAFITGYTDSSNFPTTSGVYDSSYNGGGDIFVAELSSDGRNLIFSTFYGGSNLDSGVALVLGDQDKVYVTGYTYSSDFPVTMSAHSYSYQGGMDAYVFELSNDGTYYYYSTYLGGSSEDSAYDIDLDNSGNAYITGVTHSNDFLTTSGAYDTSYNGGDFDIFVSKLSSDGTTLVYSTYLGGTGYDTGYGIVVDKNTAEVYITGYTDSSNFPITTGSYDTTYNGTGDIYVAKLNSAGNSIEESTYIGGTNTEYGNAIAIDSNDNVYITGITLSANFPITADAYSSTINKGIDAFIIKLNPTISTLLYSTYMGGGNIDSGSSIKTDSSGYVYITGYATSTDFPTTIGVYQENLNNCKDVYVAKINPEGSDIIFSTYIGGSNVDSPSALDIDSNGNVYVTGYTYSDDFPTTNSAYDTSLNGYRDGFLFKLSSNGSNLIFSTYLGGSSYDRLISIKVGSNGNVYVAGGTYSSDFPVTTDAYDNTYNDGGDGCLSIFDSNGSSLIYSTFLGGSSLEEASDICFDNSNNIIIAGYTYSSDFPVTVGGSYWNYHGGSDTFIIKFNADVSNYIFSTYLGGSGNEYVYAVDSDSNNNICIVGYTDSIDLQTTSGTLFESFNGGMYDGFVSKINSLGTELLFSTYFGGSGYDAVESLKFDNNGNIWVCGYTESSNLSVTDGSIDPTYNGEGDGFIASISGDGTTLNYSTYIGGSNSDAAYDIDIDLNNNVFVLGTTYSSNFPTTSGVFDTHNNFGSDSFILKLSSRSTYTIVATAGEHGTIDPSGTITVNNGDTITFTIIPDDGYLIADVIVDGESVGRVDSYTFTNVNSDHTIEAIFATSLLPEISRAIGTSDRGTAPYVSKFHCEAQDPDGGDIEQYIWLIQSTDFTDTVTTYKGDCKYEFVNPGTYQVSVTVVDDEGETATAVLKDAKTGNDLVIEVIQPTNYKVIVPVNIGIAASKSKDINIENSIAGIINITNQTVGLSITYYDSSGNNVETQNYTIEPNGKFNYNPETYNSGNYPYALMEADNYVLAYTKVITDSGQMTSYLLPQYSGKLYIPHIAEETDYWETNMYISALQSTDLKVKVDTQESQYSIPQFSTTINLEDLLGENVDEAKTWGTVESIPDNPFGGTQSLSGFEIFQHNGTDGAGVELQSSGSTTLFIPHIPEETDIFWTGFTIVNPNDEDANLTIDLYTSEGEKVSTVYLTIPAQSKLKGLASDLFGDAYGNAEWGTIRSDKEIFGIEIYGTVANGICGYSLPSIATTEGYLPELITGDNLWNGIAITNPSNEDATVTISLISSNGTIKATKEIQLGSMQRFKSVVKDFFEGIDIESTDYIYYNSTTSVLAIEVSGDLDRTFMFSLVGKE